MGDKLSELNSLKETLRNGGGEAAINKQHSLGKLTARERLERLFDPGSFIETGVFVKHRAINFSMESKTAPAEGVITGYGQVNGRLVYAISQDFTVLNGAVGEMHAKKISKCQKAALTMGAPIVTIYDCGGVRVEEGLDALSGYAKILKNNASLSGVVPQVAVVLGNCAGVLSASVAMNDFVFMVDKNSHLFVNGPQVINSLNKENVNSDSLGGALTHSTITGLADYVGTSDDEVLIHVKNLLTFMPQNNLEKSEVIDANDDMNRTCKELNDIIPENGPYDMRSVISSIADNNHFIEAKKDFGKSIITGLIRLNGKSVAVVASNPSENDGVLDNDSCIKAARFIRTMDVFNMPVLTIEDASSFKVDSKEENNGLIRNISKLAFAYGEASVPLVTLVTRKAHGGAYVVMCSKDIGADMVYAWPSASIGVIAAEGAVNIIYDKEIKTSNNAKKEHDDRLKEYDEKMMNPYVAASRGYVDDIIAPENTRKYLISAFDALESKVVDKPKKKHGNIAL